MKNNLKETIKRGKWLNDTLLTILTIVIVVGAVVGLNIFLEKQNITDIDLTKERLHSLSDESKEKIKNIKHFTTITLYGMSDYSDVLDYIQQYKKESNLIAYEELQDVTTRPDLQEKYDLGESITGKVIIVEANGREKIISASSLYSYDYESNSSLNVTEQMLTNAILDVNLENHPQIYFVTNHAQNANYLEAAKENLRNEANEVEDLDLLVEGKIPENCNVLVLSAVKEDYTEHERDMIIEYINNGGNIMILEDANVYNAELPNLQAILDLYGASIGQEIIFEENTSKMLAGYPNFIIPNVNTESDITKYISADGKVAVLGSGYIKYKSSEELEKLGITKVDLITATETSFKRSDIESQIGTKTEGDEDASGVAISSLLTKKISEEKTSKLILYANSVFLTDYTVPINTSSDSSSQIIAINLYNNKVFLLNSISYLTNRSDNIVARKDLGLAVTYTTTERQKDIIEVIIIAIPTAITLTGIAVWQVRRRKK